MPLSSDEPVPLVHTPRHAPSRSLSFAIMPQPDHSNVFNPGESPPSGAPSRDRQESGISSYLDSGSPFQHAYTAPAALSKTPSLAVGLEIATTAVETPAVPDIYNRFTRQRKKFIVYTVSYCALMSPFASSSFLPSIPQISQDLNTDATVVNYTVAIFLVSIALAPLLWSPFATYYGRRPVYLASLPLFALGSMGVALSKTLPALILTRIVQGIGSSSVLSVGAGSISDVYPPAVRGSAMSIYILGAMVSNGLLHKTRSSDS